MAILGMPNRRIVGGALRTSGIHGAPTKIIPGAAKRTAQRAAMAPRRAAGIAAAKARSQALSQARRGKMISRSLLGGSVGAMAFGAYRNRTGPAADKTRGRPTGPYMY